MDKAGSKEEQLGDAKDKPATSKRSREIAPRSKAKVPKASESLGGPKSKANSEGPASRRRSSKTPGSPPSTRVPVPPKSTQPSRQPASERSRKSVTPPPVTLRTIGKPTLTFAAPAIAPAPTLGAAVPPPLWAFEGHAATTVPIEFDEDGSEPPPTIVDVSERFETPLGAPGQAVAEADAEELKNLLSEVQRGASSFDRLLSMLSDLAAALPK